MVWKTLNCGNDGV